MFSEYLLVITIAGWYLVISHDELKYETVNGHHIKIIEADILQQRWGTGPPRDTQSNKEFEKQLKLKQRWNTYKNNEGWGGNNLAEGQTTVKKLESHFSFRT